MTTKRTRKDSRAPIALMTCDSGRHFAETVAGHMGNELTPSTETWFACGEGKFEIGANVRGHDVYIFQSVAGVQDDLSIYDRFIMLLHAIEAAALSDAQYITAVLPYYPSSRQDKKKGRTREGISAGLFARMMQSAGVDRVMTVEIHNDAIAGMFNPSMAHLENVFLTKHLVKWLKKQKLTGDVVVSPDVGYLGRARAYAEELSADLAALSKERDYSKPNKVFRSTLIGEVQDRDVLLVDDIIDTAGSVVSAIDELKNQGARNINVACVHPLLNGPAWERLSDIHTRATNEGWNFQMVGTTVIGHDNPPDWYKAFPVEKLIAQVLEKINSRGSVTGVQDNAR
ncbi:MAG: ribose-phosphate pyrophosphokinase [Gammaproteobacteria bacterium]|jgi:ribose-phosphate pyrophosphokinase|nr:ribose-phosphate pyrophosphokinase [Gammaproteobacteria bacterium]MBT4491616.1 ribose-phosphate pyrophosphokinase [Gammaproteobacteria bacterium]MBT7371910.1 ribose-phosphate pyrophosphokinase [Gammaproteobacteria bacterium]